MELDEVTAREICNRLKEYDSEISEIVQFGSSVYAPEFARDIDLLVFTKSRKGGYFDYAKCLEGSNLPFEVDLIVKEEGESLGRLALGIVGANRVLWGDGTRLTEAAEGFDPTFDEAWASIETARRYMRYSEEVEDGLVKDRHIREAFNELSHSARIASLVYLSKERLGWGGIESGLPPRYKREFGEFFKILHVNYFYEGSYPEEVKEEFEKWVERVEAYVRGLESEIVERG